MTTQKDPFLRDPRTLYEILGVPNFSNGALIKDRGNALLYFQSDDIELASGVFERDSIPHSDRQGAWEIESVLGGLRFTDPSLYDLDSPAAKLAHVAPKFFPSDYDYYDGLDNYGSLHSLMRARRHAFALLTNPEFKPEYDRSLGADVDSKWRPTTPNPDRGVDLASEDLPRDPNAGEMPEGAAHSHLSHYVIERRAHSVNRVPVASRTIKDLSAATARKEHKEKREQILTLLKRMTWLALLLATTWLIARNYSQTILGPVLVFLSYGIIKSRGFRRQILPRPDLMHWLSVPVCR
ncbi:hypothetical protein [Brachybacterium sp. p3-SID957]|uniref:hypothetical protein n=1 Tax=Brachybacterium sp. p3-SID957 TaxID=2916049 RepID=UPI00223A9266|nr:hypothetical protein [Brachybacterium sp. p3-SID957]MCT1777219.1 hypothetical protein [Brachybacterium sp. p3-SID957]